MKAKLTFIAGIAVGYVLGSRAGHGSYEKIKSSVKEFWAKDAVQESVAAVQDTVKEQAGDAVHKLVQHVLPSHEADTDSGKRSSGTATDPLDSTPLDGNPLDLLPEVSDEFPDAALPGGEGQQWHERGHADGHLPDAGR